MVVSYSQCNVLTGHHCVLEIIWSVISWYLSYHLSFQKNMRMLNFFFVYIYLYTAILYKRTNGFWVNDTLKFTCKKLKRGGRRGRMVVGFTTVCTISAYHHLSCEFEPRSWRCVLDTPLYDQVSQWLAAGQGFSPGIPVSSRKKTVRHDVTEILLKVALNTINQPNKTNKYSIFLVKQKHRYKIYNKI